MGYMAMNNLEIRWHGLSWHLARSLIYIDATLILEVTLLEILL
jgi:hypothetical protein